MSPVPVQGDLKGRVTPVFLQDTAGTAKRSLLRSASNVATATKGKEAVRMKRQGLEPGTYSLNLLVRSRNWLRVNRLTSNLQRFWNSR